MSASGNSTRHERSRRTRRSSRRSYLVQLSVVVMCPAMCETKICQTTGYQIRELPYALEGYLLQFQSRSSDIRFSALQQNLWVTSGSGRAPSV